MFEGKNTITFSTEATLQLISKNMSDLFNKPIEVTAVNFDYRGLEVVFTEPQKKLLEEPEPEETKVDELATLEEKAKE